MKFTVSRAYESYLIDILRRAIIAIENDELPSWARDAHYSGTVTVEITTGEDTVRQQEVAEHSRPATTPSPVDSRAA